jgi:transcriptional regulator with XRE-family HTH domain
MLGELLRDRRKAVGITAEEIGDALGISKAYMSLLEKGKRPISQRFLFQWDDAFMYLVRYKIHQMQMLKPVLEHSKFRPYLGLQPEQMAALEKKHPSS